jgi:hypothetical protein
MIANFGNDFMRDGLRVFFKSLGLLQLDYIILAVGLVILESVHFIQRKYGSVTAILAPKPVYIRWILYYAMLIMILFLGKSAEQFIYVQF